MEASTTPLSCACGCGARVRRVRYPNCQRQPRFVQGHQHKGPNNGNYRGGQERRACPVCLASFYSFPSQIKVTCGGDACYRTWQGLTSSARGINKIEVACAHCGQVLKRFPSQARQRAYCNRFCAAAMEGRNAGAAAGQWRGGKIIYLRRQAAIRDGHRCVVCGFDAAIEAHHITTKKLGGTDVIENLITLCPNHHRMAHRGLIGLESYRRTDWRPESTAPHASASRSRTESS